MKPICVPCRRFYRREEIGVAFIEGMSVGAGTTECKPYKLWHGDLWKCHGCGHLTISGVANKPLAEHFETDFAQHVESWRATIQINDY